MLINRRIMILGAGSVALVSSVPAAMGQGASPKLAVATRSLDIRGRAAKVYGVLGPKGENGLNATEGDRFTADLLNGTSDPLVMHWHGQIHAGTTQDRARPNGGVTAVGAMEPYDFALTPGTHWMHSHQLTEQQLLAAPMITREMKTSESQEIVMMLHDFAFRSPAEILAELTGSSVHGGQAASSSATQRMGSGMNPGAGHQMMGGMNGMKAHANDVAYDAYLANDRTLDDPEIIRIDKGGRARLRIINGATATAFFIDTGTIDAVIVAVDGSPCGPFTGRHFPLAQGQRIDLLLSIPAEGGTFPILALVEDDLRRTGIILATPGSSVTKISDMAGQTTGSTTLDLDRQLRAKTPLVKRTADRAYHLMLGEEADYRWTLNGKVHGQHIPLEARLGERVEIMMMNPSSMMHPMHLHGHHFQVVGVGTTRYSGPMRDTVIVPPRMPVTIAFDANKRGEWYLHCHHLYHMAAGMMTELAVT